MDTSEIVFDDLSPIEVPVKLAGERYILREISEDGYCKWRNSQFRATRFTTDGKSSIMDGLADSEPLLVSLCLYRTNGDGKVPIQQNGDADPSFLVPLEVVRRWFPRVVRRLHDRAKEISRLNEDESEEGNEGKNRGTAGTPLTLSVLPNSPSATAGSSA